MNIEQALTDSIVRIAILPTVDQYGNQTDSPLKLEIRKWAYEKREDIAAALVKKFNRDEFADMVSKRIVEELIQKRWDTKYSEEELSKQVMKNVAERLADEQIKIMNQKKA